MPIFSGFAVAPAIIAPFGQQRRDTTGAGLSFATRASASREKEERLQQQFEDKVATQDIFYNASLQYNLGVTALKHKRESYKNQMADLIWQSGNPFRAIESDEYKKLREGYMLTDMEEAGFKSGLGTSKMYADIGQKKLEEKDWPTNVYFGPRNEVVGVTTKNGKKEYTHDLDEADYVLSNQEMVDLQVRPNTPFSVNLGESVYYSGGYEPNQDQTEILALLSKAGSISTETEFKDKKSSEELALNGINKLMTVIKTEKSNLLQLNSLGEIFRGEMSEPAQKANYAKFIQDIKGDQITAPILKPIFDEEDNGDIKIEKKKMVDGTTQDIPVFQKYTQSDVDNGTINPVTGEKAKVGENKFEQYKKSDYQMWLGDQIAKYETGFSIIEESAKMNLRTLGEDFDAEFEQNISEMYATGNPPTRTNQVWWHSTSSTSPTDRNELAEIKDFLDGIINNDPVVVNNYLESRSYPPSIMAKITDHIRIYKEQFDSGEGINEEFKDFVSKSIYNAINIGQPGYNAEANRELIEADVKGEMYVPEPSAGPVISIMGLFSDRYKVGQQSREVVHASVANIKTAERINKNVGIPVKHWYVPDSYINTSTLKLQNLKGLGVILPGDVPGNPTQLPVDATVVKVTDGFQFGGPQGLVAPGVIAIVLKSDLSKIEFFVKDSTKPEGKRKTNYKEMMDLMDLGILDLDKADPTQIQVYKNILYGPNEASKGLWGDLDKYVAVPFIPTENYFSIDGAVMRGNKNPIYFNK